jgi:GT2 family glycosyltransferase
VRSTAVVPVHDSRGWLPSCLAALEGQGFAEVVVVDDASTDDTVAWLAAEHPEVRVVSAGSGGGPVGFARAAQAGVDAAGGEAVALVNADVTLAPGWLAATRAALGADPGCGAVACKMVRRDEPGRIDDAGDVLRRDGVCEQRGRLRADDGRWDVPGEVWGACAGAALYRAAALREARGFAPVYRNYLEDVDLALALRSAGWRCAYVPAVALHAGGGSAAGLPAPVRYWVARNTLVLVARWFPVRWWPLVAYRQASWLVAAARDRVLGAHLRGLAAGLAAGAREWPGRHARRRGARVAIADAVPARPWRGPAAGGHPAGER